MAAKPVPSFALGWLRHYDAARFRGDLLAGITVGVVLIPQGMAYALLAGIPPVYGLYASLVPLFIYSIFGTSRHLAVGVVAIDSLIVAASIAALAPASGEGYMEHVFALALMVGVIQLALGFLKFGFIVNLLSRPVIAGFTTAAVLIIGFSQLKHLLGIGISQNLNIFVLLAEAFSKLGELHVQTFAVGAAGIAILVGGKRFFPRLPGPLLAVFISSLAVYFLNLDEQGVAIVGTIPSGLPSMGVPSFSLQSLKALLPTALTLSMIQFMGVISLGKISAARHGYQVQPNRELIALGAMNLVGSFFQSQPVSGSFSRSAVNEQTGAQTPFANAIAAALVGLTLLFFTPLFYYLPIPVFASIIMVTAFGLIDVRELRYLFKTKAVDGSIALATFFSTLVIGIHQGVLVGVALSVIAIMYRISRPNVAVLGHLHHTRSFRDIRNHASAHEFKDIVMMRVDASFSFSNANRIRDIVLRQVRVKDARALILDATTVNDLDTTALAVLSDINKVLQDRGIQIYIAGAKQKALDLMRASGVMQEIGEEHFFLSPHRALSFVLARWGREDEYRMRQSQEDA